MDFKGIIDCIFINKNKYWEISDEDKEKNFFIINRKFSRNHPKVAQLFNDKNVDKSSALDRWFYFFENQNRIPQWYWGNKENRSAKKEKVFGFELIERENLKENDVLFLNKFYKEELNKEIKKIKRYD